MATLTVEISEEQEAILQLRYGDDVSSAAARHLGHLADTIAEELAMEEREWLRANPPSMGAASFQGLLSDTGALVEHRRNRLSR